MPRNHVERLLHLLHVVLVLEAEDERVALPVDLAEVTRRLPRPANSVWSEPKPRPLRAQNRDRQRRGLS